MLCTAHFYKFFYSEADQCIFIAHDVQTNQNVKLYTYIIVRNLFILHSVYRIFMFPSSRPSFPEIAHTN